MALNVEAGGGVLVIVRREDTIVNILAGIHDLRWWLRWSEKQERGGWRPVGEESGEGGDWWTSGNGGCTHQLGLGFTEVTGLYTPSLIILLP